MRKILQLSILIIISQAAWGQCEDTPSPSASKSLVCSGETFTLSATGCSGGTVYWYRNTSSNFFTSSSSPISVSLTGDTKYIAKCGFSCTNIGETIVKVKKVEIVKSTANICTGESVTLTASSSPPNGAAGAVTYKWLKNGTPIVPNGTNQTYDVTQGGATYKIEVTETSTSCMFSSFVYMNDVSPYAPFIEGKVNNNFVSSPISIGIGGSVTLLNDDGCPGGTTTTWFTNGVANGQTGNSVTVSPTAETTSYTAKCITDANSCASVPSNTIVVNVLSCANTLSLTLSDNTSTGTSASPVYRRAVQTITAVNKIGDPTTGASVFIAGNSITLSPGFEVKGSSYFVAKIDNTPCSSN